MKRGRNRSHKGSMVSCVSTVVVRFEEKVLGKYFKNVTFYKSEMWVQWYLVYHIICLIISILLIFVF